MSDLWCILTGLQVSSAADFQKHWSNIWMVLENSLQNKPIKIVKICQLQTTCNAQHEIHELKGIVIVHIPA